MTATEIKDVSPEAIRIVAAGLRDQDATEVYLLTRKPHHEALVEAVASSKHSKCLYFDGQPGGLFGLAELSPEVGVPWMVGTDLMVTHAKSWLRKAVAMRDIYHKHYPTLTNIAHCDNTKSIRWLQGLGFEFSHEPVPGHPGFIQFTRTHHV
jgi:hypothetical protein